MDLFERLEHGLEGVLEGVFSRAFRAPLQPIEVAKRLSREMENHRTVSVNSTYVPNVYTVHLSPDMHDSYMAISVRLLGEFAQFLRDFAIERRYEMVGPITIHLAADESLKANELRITVANEAAAPSPTPPAQPAAPVTLPRPPMPRPMAPAPRTVDPLEHTALLVPEMPTGVEIISGEKSGTRVPLTNGMTIGRGPANTLAINEPGISRFHAEITQQGTTWVINDLSSTNGTYVNGTMITAEQPLRVGDRILVGRTALTVR